MAEIVDGKFACAACGKRFTWKPELAGRKGKCTCGAELRIPAAPPAAKAAAPAPAADDLYDLAPAHDAPAPAARSKPAAPAPAPSASPGKSQSKGAAPQLAAAGAAVRTTASGAPVVPYRGSTRRDEEESEIERKSQFIDLWLPISLIVIGVMFHFAQEMYFSDDPIEGMTQAVSKVGILLVGKMILIALGCLIAIKILDIAFGSPGPAVLKLAAIALAPGALGGILTYVMGGGFVAVIAGAVLSIIIYWALFKVLFDLDFGEIMALVTIIWLINQWVLFFVLGFFLSRFG
jgi:hypothetical protein